MGHVQPGCHTGIDTVALGVTGKDPSQVAYLLTTDSVHCHPLTNHVYTNREPGHGSCFQNSYHSHIGWRSLSGYAQYPVNVGWVGPKSQRPANEFVAGLVEYNRFVCGIDGEVDTNDTNGHCLFPPYTYDILRATRSDHVGIKTMHTNPSLVIY
jgi:hypothetical protein